MRKIPAGRTILFTVVALAVAVVVPDTASAAPTFHFHAKTTDGLFDMCGFAGRFDASENVVITLTDNGNKETFEATLFYTVGERTVTLHAAGQDTFTTVQNGDTITIDDTHIGLDLKLSARGSGGVTLRDAGWISTITTINLVTGESTIQVDVHGPHPEADRTAFCAAFADAFNG
jgi:hypothetical protein